MPVFAVVVALILICGGLWKIAVPIICIYLFISGLASFWTSRRGEGVLLWFVAGFLFFIWYMLLHSQ